MPQVLDIGRDSAAAIEAAAVAVTAGECIVLPTDTVYGIGVNAFDATAVQRLLDAKQRGRDMPPPVLVADMIGLLSLVEESNEQIEAVAEAFWPGALTLIVRAQPSLRLGSADRGATVAVRIPDHSFARELLRATGPLAVSSANVSGDPAATTITEAVEQLGASVAVYLDGGPCGNAVPSTIVDLTGTPRILREGRLSAAELAAVLPELAEG